MRDGQGGGVKSLTCVIRVRAEFEDSDISGYSYRQGQLMVHVDSARNLAAADSNGFSDPYVKTYLLPDHSKHSKRKTDIQRKTLNPSYNRTLVVR